MKTFTLFGMLFLSFVSSAKAEKALSAYDIANDYSNSNTFVRTLVLESDATEPVIAISIVTGTANCTGDMAGIGKLKENTLIVTPYSKSEGNNCILTMEFDKGGKQVQVKESDCDYHGAACTFDGTLTASK
jgi:hypothetical protein